MVENCEPAPSTMPVPRLPAAPPRIAVEAVTRPPLRIRSVPVPTAPDGERRVDVPLRVLRRDGGGADGNRACAEHGQLTGDRAAREGR